MYVPSAFSVDERDPVLDLIEACPFAVLVSPQPGDLQISHVPLALHRRDAGWGTLTGHVARPNPHWRCFDGRRECVAIFQGPHAYVSPGWYASAPAVPTWNYVVVHAYGRPAVIEDPERTSAVLDELVARHEPGGGPLDLPESFRRSLEQGITAFEFEIERVEAKFKLGQNRSAADREATARALEQAGATELAAWTRRIAGPR